MLIFSELKKLIGNKSFLLYILLLALVNLFLIWFFNEPNIYNPPQEAYKLLSQDLSGMSMEEKGEYISQRYEYAEAMYILDDLYMVGNLNGTDDAYYQNLAKQHEDKIEQYGESYAQGAELRYTDSLQGEFSFLSAIDREYRQVAGYEQFLADIDEAGANLSSISIFADVDSYDNKNIQSTREMYRGMSGTEIDYLPQKGITTATSFIATDIVLIFAMVLISFALIQREKEMGLLRLIRCTAAGRTKTALAKLIALSVTLFGVVVILYGSNLIFCEFAFGIGDLTRTVQSVPDLMRSTLSLNVAQYLLAFMATKWVAALICGIWILLAMLIANRLITGVVLSLILPAVFYLIRQAIPATSVYNVFRYANPISYLQTDEILGSYRNLHWFGGVISMVVVEVCSAFIFSAIILAFYFLLFRYGQFAGMGQSMLYLPRLKKFRLTTVFKTEWRKVLFLNGGLVVIIAVIAFEVYQTVTFTQYLDVEETIYKNYMQTLNGPLDEEKGEFLMAEEVRFAEIEKLEKDLRYGVIGEQQFNMALSTNYMMYEEYKVFTARIMPKVNYIQANPGAQFLYDSGYRMLFGINDAGEFGDTFESTVVAVIMTVVILGGYFSIERISGVRRILYSTPLGREQTVKTKLINSVVICFIITAITTIPLIVKTAKTYGLDGLLAPAKSMPEFSAVPAIFSILSLIIFSFLIRLVATAFVAAVTLTLSQYNDSYITVVMINLTVFLLPLILMFIGLDFVSWVTIYPQFNLTQLITTGFLAGIVPIFFAAVMGYATFVLCGRMVDKYCWNFTDI